MWLLGSFPTTSGWSRSPLSSPGQHHLHQQRKQGRALPGTISVKGHACLILNVCVQQGREAAYPAGHLQAEEWSCFPFVKRSHWVTVSGRIKIPVDVSLRDRVWWGLTSARLRVGPNDLSDLFQYKWFCDSEGVQILMSRSLKMFWLYFNGHWLQCSQTGSCPDEFDSSWL